MNYKRAFFILAIINILILSLLTWMIYSGWQSYVLERSCNDYCIGINAEYFDMDNAFCNCYFLDGTKKFIGLWELRGEK